MSVGMRDAKHKKRRAPQFELIAGPVCLDFVNTLDDRFSGEPKELLRSYADLARFAEDTGILDPGEADQLCARAEAHPEMARRALYSARAMREAMAAVVDAIRKGKSIPQAPVAELNQFLREAAQHAQLVQANGRFEWRFDASPGRGTLRRRPSTRRRGRSCSNPAMRRYVSTRITSSP